MNLTLTNLHPSLRPPLSRWRRIVRNLFTALCSEPERLKAPEIQELSIVWLDDPQMAISNWQFLRHKGPTDILTFDYHNGTAEILISLDTAGREARQRRRKLEQELTLYIAHGMLHLAGIGDKTPSQRRRMRQEEKWLIYKIQK